MPSEKEKLLSGYEAVKKLSTEYFDWIPIITFALEQAKLSKGQEFAGKWVLEKAREKGIVKTNLKRLVKYGILKKERTVRKGRRAYYTMPDPEGVERALKELKIIG